MPSTSGKKKGPLLPAYLIVGANELMRNEAVARMKGRLEPGLDVFNLDERAASADLSAGDIIASLNTVPMGTGPRIVLITEADRLPKPVSEAIIEYLKNPNPGCTLCLVSEKLAKNTRLYKALAKVGPHSVVDCAPKKRWELPKTVLKMGSVHGVQIDQDAAEELISRVGESTTMLDTQVKTLASLCRATGRVTRADVEAHVVRTAEVKPWDFLDAVCDRDAARALGLYQLMQKPSQIALTSLLTGRIRELICARSLASRGQANDLAQRLGKQSWQVKNHMRWSRRFSDEDLRRALCACADCERSLKTGGDPDITFVRLVMEICGAA
ncbi:MAG: DNA polymerase III subunit delta [Olegusella sp.]|nr:DNA polymerase III subunit delta [Olegusella sp.]